MKTTKVILVAALMAFAAISFAQNDAVTKNVKPRPELSALISVKSAMHNPGLTMAMRDQLSPSFLLVEQPIYTVKVNYKKAVYYVYGPYIDWRHFFAIKTYPNVNKG